MDLFGLKKKKALETEQETQEYLLSEDTPFNVREAFNTLRTNVVFGMAPSGGKRLLVTSANQSEGKSTTSVNLAVALAQNGAKVLLIDADLRKPKLHKFFNTDYTHGLSRFLIGQETLNDALFRTPVKNLDLMTSGIIPPNPSELLGSSRMKLFLEKAEEYYDYIIIDTPPINVVTDAAVLSKIVSGVLIVVHYGSTDRDDFQKAKNQLQMVGANIIGFSVVGVRSEHKGYYKKYYKSYDSYGYGYGDSYRKHRKQSEEGETE
ncbi:MAG: CpsD/CapB family tyrosine-protein kinase [Clostridia bacterium]|nr:CpsD/CapB family tyrosine-protein kinase [Clostridia bacterium]